MQTSARLAFRFSFVLALAYVVYVVVMKLTGSLTGGPLGDVGEFLLVLVCVSAFATGLFIEEARLASKTPTYPETR